MSPADHLQHNVDHLSSGTAIHHWLCPGRPTATVLFQHGFADYAERWVKDYPFFLEDLHKRNIDVWAMDFHGHGRSPGERSVCHIGKAVQDHIELRARLTGQNQPPLYLYGHSLGGLVSACSASRNANGVAGVVLEAPALADPSTPLVRRFASFVAATVPSWQIPGPAPDLDGLSSNKEWIQRWVADETVFHGRISWLLGATALRESLEL